MLGAESLNRRVVVSFAIALVGVVNVAGVGRAAEHVNAGTNGPEIIRVLRREGLTRGYAPFWDAQSLTWQSGMRLLVAPVHTCHPPRGRDLCRDNFFTIDSWYDERPGPSFLIVDPAGGLWTKPPHALGRPTEAHHFGSNVTVYVYPYDIARQIRS